MGRVDDRWLRKKDKSKTALYGKGKRWLAVWIVAGEEKKKAFATKDAAKEHVTWVEHHQHSGTYVNANRAKVRVHELLPLWLETQAHLKESTLSTLTYDVEGGIASYWGGWTLADVERTDIQTWVNRMDKAPRTVDTIYGRFKAFLKWCVEEKRLMENPAIGVNLPQGKRREHMFLTPRQIEALAAAIGEQYAGLVWVLASTGMRMSELCELRVRDFDRRRKRVLISRAVVFVGGTAVVGTPKNGEPRSAPLTKKAWETIDAMTKGKDADDLIFTSSRGLQIRANNFKRRDFDNAVALVRQNAVEARAQGTQNPVTIPEGLWVHDLRHTAASWAVQSGASVKSVQRMLGHAKAAITLDVYAGLFDQDLDDVALKMDALISGRDSLAT